jgi:hypothetical protein
MARLLLKVVLGLSLLAGLALLLAGHQLYLFQLVSRGESPGERLLIGALVPRFEAMLGTEAMLAPQTLTGAWAIGGVAAGVGILGLFVIGLQDSARARRAARLVPPPVFDERDLVSSHHFVADGLRMWTNLCLLLTIPCFLILPFPLWGLYATATSGRWLEALLLLGAVATFVIMAVFLVRRARDPRPKHGVERIDIMLGGLRWVRHDDPTVRTVAWSQVSGCTSNHNLVQPWKNQTVVTLRTGEQIWLWACCLANYDNCLDLVERGRKGGGLSAPYSGNAGLAVAFRFNR